MRAFPSVLVNQYGLARSLPSQLHPSRKKIQLQFDFHAGTSILHKGQPAIKSDSQLLVTENSPTHVQIMTSPAKEPRCDPLNRARLSPPTENREENHIALTSALIPIS